MSKLREQVIEFHRANELPGQGAGPPGSPGADRIRLRVKLVAEEFGEFMWAIGAANVAGMSIGEFVNKCVESINLGRMSGTDLPELADALADLDYVIEGTRLEFGIDGGPIADEVHRSNLAKRWPDGLVHKRDDGKILKPPGWTPPDIAGELRKQGWNG